VIRIHKSTQPPEKLLTEGKKKRKSHCLSYTRNSQDYQNGEKKFSFNSNIYAHKDVKTALIRSQHGKCCFCEQIIHEEGDVEHFRPKGAYKQELRKPLEYPGYYWLAYEWDNLYLACTACNQRHKENLFPLINPEDRATSHHDNIKIEKPIFINPGKEDPENFIQFNGEIPVGIDKEALVQCNCEAETLTRQGINREHEVEAVLPKLALFAEYQERQQELVES
jgi:uncharacterized protein (TIGR02646 family)